MAASKQDYEAVAKVLYAEVEALAYEFDDGTKDMTFFPDGAAARAVERVARGLAGVFASNPRFDQARFFAAAGFPHIKEV